VISTALDSNDMHFLLLCYKLYKDFNIFLTSEFHEKIIEQYELDVENIEIYLFFTRKFIHSFSLKHLKQIIRLYEDMVNITHEHNEIINKLANPFKILVLISEILKVVQKINVTINFAASRVLKKALGQCETIQNLIEEDNVLREIMIETDIGNRTTMEIISDNNFLGLLENKIVEKIIKETWEGMYELKSGVAGLLETSSQFHSLSESPATKDYDIFSYHRNNLFATCEASGIGTKDYKSSFTQLNVWKKHIFC
jgi:DNA integrity scanning protein DisA with diadenylate cyclase activity